MNKQSKVLILNLPSPPLLDVDRNWAGGFGIAMSVRRKTYGQSGKPSFHSFLPYASAVLSNGSYDYSVLDCQRLKYNAFQVLSKVKKLNPDIILGLVGLPSLKKDLELFDMIKNSLPDTIIVSIGTVGKFFKNDILLKSKTDVVSKSNYPYVSNLFELLRAIDLKQDLKNVPGISYLKNKRIIDSVELPDVILDELPLPNYENLRLDGYEDFLDLDGNKYNYIPILGGKGCPHSCIYCPYPLGFGKEWTHRSPNDIVNQIEYLCSRGVKGFLFRDQSFTMDNEYTTRICEEIINRKLNIAWFCEARVNQISRGLLETMKKAGCKRIHYGVETGDPQLLECGKPNTKLDLIRKVFCLTKKARIWATANVILGWPDESYDTIAKTSSFLKEIDPDFINWNILTPYPGTKLYKIAKEEGLILTSDWSKYTSHNVVMRTKYLDGNQLRIVANNLIRNYAKREVLKLLKSTGKRPRLVVNELKQIVTNYFI